MIDYGLSILTAFLAILIILPLHEFAHAFVAVKCGDNTPKMYKRYTLNPFAHFDVMGLLLFVFFGFGWAKPVPINPYNFKKYKRDSVLVALAGVTVNLITAFAIYPLFLLSFKISGISIWGNLLNDFLFYLYSYSLAFFVFNLLPLYPLDGFRVIETFCNNNNKFYLTLKQYSQFILIGLILLSYFDIFDIFSYINHIVSLPITLFWGLFF